MRVGNRKACGARMLRLARRQLRQAAQKIRRLDAQAVSGSLFNDILTPEAYALLFEDLAAKADPGT